MSEARCESAIRTVLSQLRLPEDQMSAVVEATSCAMARPLGDGGEFSTELTPNQTLIAMLPEIRIWAIRYFKLKGVARSDVDDLASEVVTKVCLAADRNQIARNARGYVSRVMYHEFADYCRRQTRERKCRPLLEPEAVVDQLKSEEQAEQLWTFVEGLPKDIEHIVDRIMAGDSLLQIAKDCGMSRLELKKKLQTLDWPGGFF